MATLALSAGVGAQSAQETVDWLKSLKAQFDYKAPTAEALPKLQVSK